MTEFAERYGTDVAFGTVYEVALFAARSSNNTVACSPKT